ncbi:HAD family hydrolase [Streptomyces californicus]|uniref:HAD family hydrolase n=1 Tax=Streptomyces californicus TaxID=67351 RepID=UPI00296F5819|nr:haloacid dehalogenase-like hydrolase [Streptomyces californicus]MDW4916310.1 haloacid dehalogenase-like hydrolase [Streptomyces californicus]
MTTLVLWDIDRTLLYVGDIDRLVYREAFRDVVGREATKLPARGTGVTMPLAVRELLTANDVSETDVEPFADLIVDRLPDLLEAHREDLVRHGKVMPGAEEALAAVRRSPDLTPTVVTGNLRRNAEIKLSAKSLLKYVNASIGGYASDNPHRPNLVGIAQSRAAERHGKVFDSSNTIIIGDSLQDVTTGIEGGAKVIGVTSGTTSAQQLADAGAHLVIPDLRDSQSLLSLIRSLSSQ